MRYAATSICNSWLANAEGISRCVMRTCAKYTAGYKAGQNLFYIKVKLTSGMSPITGRATVMRWSGSMPPNGLWRFP